MNSVINKNFFKITISVLFVLSVITLFLFYSPASIEIYGHPIKLGSNINESGMKDTIDYLGLSEGGKYSDSFFYNNYEKGLEFCFNSNGKLIYISLYSGPDRLFKDYWDVETIKYTGEVPINGIQMTDSRGDVERTLGLPSLPSTVKDQARYLINRINVTFNYDNKRNSPRPNDKITRIVLGLPKEDR